jgi:hypothetical protein
MVHRRARTISTRTSPAANESPSLSFQDAMPPSFIVGDMAGICMLVTARAVADACKAGRQGNKHKGSLIQRVKRTSSRTCRGSSPGGAYEGVHGEQLAARKRPTARSRRRPNRRPRPAAGLDGGAAAQRASSFRPHPAPQIRVYEPPLKQYTPFLAPLERIYASLDTLCWLLH